MPAQQRINMNLFLTNIYNMKLNRLIALWEIYIVYSFTNYVILYFNKDIRINKIHGFNILFLVRTFDEGYYYPNPHTSFP